MDRKQSLILISDKLQELKEECPREIEASFDLIKTYKYCMDLSKDHSFSLKKSYRIKDLSIDVKTRDEKKKTRIIKEFKHTLNKHVVELQKNFKFTYKLPNYFYLLKQTLFIEVSSILSLNYQLERLDTNKDLKTTYDFFKLCAKDYSAIEKISNDNNNFLIFFIFLDIEKIKRLNFFQIFDFLSLRDYNISFNTFLYTTNAYQNSDDVINYFNQYISNYNIKSPLLECINESLRLYLIKDLNQFKLDNLIDLTGNQIIYVTNGAFRIYDILNEFDIESFLNREKLSQYLMEIRNRKITEEELRLQQQEVITKNSKDDENMEFYNIGLESTERRRLINKEEVPLKTLNEESAENDSDVNLISRNKIKELKAFLFNYKSNHLLHFHQENGKSKDSNFIEITYDKLTSYADFNRYKSEVKTPTVIFALNNKNKHVIDNLKKSLEIKTLLKSVKFSGYYYSSSFIINIFLKILRKIRKKFPNTFNNKIKIHIIKNYIFRKNETVIKKININNKMKFDQADLEIYKKLFCFLDELRTFFYNKLIKKLNYNYHINYNILPCLKVSDYFFLPQKIKMSKIDENNVIKFLRIEDLNYKFNVLSKSKPQVILVINMIKNNIISDDCIKFLENVVELVKVTILFIGNENVVKNVIGYYYDSFKIFSHTNIEFILLNYVKNNSKSCLLANIYAFAYETKHCQYAPYKNKRNINFNLYLVVDERVLYISNEFDKMLYIIKEYSKSNERIIQKKELYNYIEYEKFTEKNLKNSLKELCKNIDNFLFVKKCKFEFSYETNLLVSQDFKELLSKRTKRPKILLDFHELDLNMLNKMIQETLLPSLPQEELVLEYRIKSGKNIISKKIQECNICKTLVDSLSYYYCASCKFYYCITCGSTEHPHSIYLPYKDFKNDIKTLLYGKVFSEIKGKGEESCYNCCQIF